MPADYKRIHDPARREHYVYRIRDEKGRVLYIGCSMNLEQRLADHRRHGLYGRFVHRVETFGPFNYQTGRNFEREAIRAEQPPYNTEWTTREQRGVALFRQVRAA